MKFGTLLSCEFYKLNKKKTTLVMVIVLLVVLLGTMGISAILKSVLSDQNLQIGVSPNYAETIQSIEAQLKHRESNRTWLDKLIIVNQEYSLKAQLAIYKYLEANDIPSGSVMMYTVDSLLSIVQFDFFSFTSMCMTLMVSIILIYALVMCCKTTAGEFHSGALKMQFIRPLDKNKFFTAKWLSIFIISEALLIGSFIVAFIMGLIVFGPDAPRIIFVAGTEHVSIVSPFAALFIELIFNSFKLFFTMQCAMFIASLFKTNAKALIAAILILVTEVGIYIDYILAIPYVGFLSFLSNLQWSKALSAAGPVFKGMSIWTMIPITFAWGALFMWLSYRRFSKREV